MIIKYLTIITYIVLLIQENSCNFAKPTTYKLLNS